VPDQRLDVVGLRDIARLLMVDGRTPTMWRHRNLLPPEDGYVSGNVPVWHRDKILAWAEATGRLPAPAPDQADQGRSATGTEASAVPPLWGSAGTGAADGGHRRST
jgi:hypothetical protein